MLDSCRHIYAGLSGGADSVCLIMVLSEVIKRYDSDIELTAVHVNHGIRAEEAERDEEFARQFCEKMDVRFISRHENVPEYAKKNRLSEEEAGRVLRYRIFNQLANEYSDSRIAVAHHCNDQAETVLHNIIRGSGIEGLGGMSPVRDNIIRPLLCVTRNEIEEYLSYKKQEFVTDSTNLCNEYTRNKIRNILIPYIEENINNAVVERISDLSQMARQSSAFIQRQSEKLYKECVYEEQGNIHIDIDRLKSQDEFLVSTVVRMALGQAAGGLRDIYKKHVSEAVSLMHMSTGKCFDISGQIRIQRVYGELVIYRNESFPEKVQQEKSLNTDKSESLIKISKQQLEYMEYDKAIRFDINRTAYIQGLGMVRIKTVSFTKSKAADYLSDNADLSSDMDLNDNINLNDNIDLNNCYTKSFDYDKITDNLFVRFRREGDVMVINKQGNNKKLKKELIDRKIPRQYRDYLLLIADEANVIWIPGIRMSYGYKPQEKCTIQVKVTIETQGENNNGI